MTIQEAIKSGKPFRRPGRKFWCIIPTFDLCVQIDGEGTVVVLGKHDLLATDWEVKP